MKQNRNKETLDEPNKYAELSAESILKWCYDPLNVSMVYSKNLQAPSKDFYKTIEPFFYHDDESNICLECINRYYEYKNKLVRRQDIDILTHHDSIRIKKLFRDKKYRNALLEIFKYNWLVLNSEDIRKDFYDLIKSCLEKKLSVFNALTFSHIYLLLFNDEAIKKYVMKSVRSHYGKGTFFIQTDHDEWDFMLNYIEYFSNLVYESEKYKDFDIKGWLNAMYIYLSIDGTYYNEKIVDILHRLFFDSDFNAQRKFEIYTVICALVKRQGSLLYRFEDILKNIFDYEFFHFIKATITGETLTTVHIIFWEPIRFYIELYPEFTKLGLEKKYYSFFSELTDEYYKKELFKVILKNHSCITNLKNFQLTFPFFEEMITNIIKIDDVKRTYFNEMNPMFVRMCVLQTYNFVFKANKYTETDWENLYELLKKWHNITVTIIKENKVKTSYNIKDLSGFILLLYFDISYFLDERIQLKISALYKFFVKNLMTIFLNAPRVFFNELDQEKLTYINIIKYYFTEDKSYSQLYSFLDENSLTQIIDKHSTFCTKFTYHSVYFTDFLMILAKCKYITIVLYSKVFMLLMTKSMQKEILELLCHLVSKIQLHRRDYTTNFILELDWIRALNELVVEHDTQHLKIVLIAKHFKFLIDNKLVYNEALVDTIRKTCKQYGIINITETANKISPNGDSVSEINNEQTSNQKKQKLVSLISDMDSSSSSCKVIQKNSNQSVIEPLSLFKNDKSNLGSTSLSNSDITITKIIQNGNNVKKINDSNENAQYIPDEGIKK